MKKIFIVNPNSGAGKGKVIGNEIKNYCNNQKINFEMIYTNKSGQATEIAKYYKDKNVVVYSVGGDGTINEIVNGLAYGKAFFNAIPAGSGNDFIKTINEYNNEIFDIDLGKVNDRMFVNSASIGIDADISNNANLMKKINIPKSQIYNVSTLYSLLKFKSYDLNINDINQLITLIAITNGKYYGGGFKIAPDAKLNDGFLNLVKAKELNRITILPVLVKLIKATHYKDSKVINEKIESIYINSKIDLNCGIDGEVLKGREFKINVEKNAIHYYNKDDLNIKRLIMSK